MSQPTTMYDYEFDPLAENNTAAAVYGYARRGKERVLDLGCGAGIVASYLKAVDGKEVTCLDAEASFLEATRSRGIERTIQADLEGPDWNRELKGQQFDVIILADVLEHLTDPGAVLDRIHDEKLLADGGYLVVSIPNASHESVVLSLLGGRFTYTESGLLDHTHLRWFTLDSFTAMCESHGYVVTRVHRTIRTIDQTQQSMLLMEFPDALRQELAARPKLETRTYQFVMRIDPMEGATKLAALREEIDQARQAEVRAVREKDATVRQLRREREEEIAALTREQSRLRDEAVATLRQKEQELEAERDTIRRLEQRVGDLVRERDRLLDRERMRDRVGSDFAATQQRLQAQVRQARMEAAQAKQKVEEIYTSETWRLGRTLLALPRRAKSALRRG